jgi:Omp85 superfamily domain
VNDWARASRASLLAVLLAATPVGAAPAPLAEAAQPRASELPAGVSAVGDSLGALDGRPIRLIRVHPLDIFEPLQRKKLGGIYGFADALHIRTRESTLRSLLLFREGEPWTAEVGAETMRRLRGFEFLVPDSILATRVRDSVEVDVTTRDTWTTSLGFNVQGSAGARSGTVAIGEGNVFGLGKSLSVSYHDETAGITRTIDWSDPAVLGTLAQFDFQAGSGSGGVSNQIAGGLPFVAENSPRAAFADWRRANGTQRLYAAGSEVVDLDVRREVLDVQLGLGAREDGTVTRWGLSYYSRDEFLGDSRVLAPAPPAFVGTEQQLYLRRVALEGTWWRPQYIERIGMESMTRIEDFDLGPRVVLKSGVSPEAFGSTADEGYAYGSVGVGHRAGGGFGLLSGSLESRWRPGPIERIAHFDARWYAPLAQRQVLVLAAKAESGQEVSRDYQLVIGGLNGLRAYPAYQLAGTSYWRFNAEDRWRMGREYWDLVSLGAALFYDAAHMWGPGAEGQGWTQNAGVGLRLALPHSAFNEVVRIDVAVPIDPAFGGRHTPAWSFGSGQAF